jgi:hypothetical protein
MHESMARGVGTIHEYTDKFTRAELDISFLRVTFLYTNQRNDCMVGINHSSFPLTAIGHSTV